ncbi:MAG: GAF domain-containing protein [Anaerolineales bacterium]|nr:GAF domain-containing protein [Anaerolineales bacterium]
MLEPILAGLLGLYLAALAWAGFVAWRRSGLSFPAAVRRFFQIPAYPDEEDNRRAHALAPLFHQGLALTLVITAVLSWPWGRQSLPLISTAAWGLAVSLSLYVLVWRGRVRLVARLVPFVAFLGLSLCLALSRTFNEAALAAYALVVVAAGLFQSGRAALIYAGLSAGLIVGLFLLQSAGWFDLNGTATPVQLLTYYVSCLAFLALLLRQGARALEESRRHARRLQGLQVEQARQLDIALQAERRRARQLELLNDFARSLTGVNDPAALTHTVTHRLVEAYSFQAAALYLVDDDAFRLSAAGGLYVATRPPNAALTLGQGVAGWVAEHDETCWLAQPAADDRFIPEAGPAPASVVAVPLRLAKYLVGVLEVAGAPAGPLDAGDVRALESLADLIVAGLQSSQLFVRLRQRQQLTEALRRAGAVVNESLDLPTVLAATCAETLAAFQADRAEVWLEDWPVPLRREACADRLAEVGGQPPPSEAAVFVDRALTSGRNLFLYPAAAGGDAEVMAGYFDGAQSLVVAALRKESRAFGALVIAEAQRAHRLTSEDAAAAELLAAQLATAVDNARLYAAHRRRADELALLNDITRAALAVGDLEQLVENLAERLSEMLGADGCFLALWSDVQQGPTSVTASRTWRGILPLLAPAAAGQSTLTAEVLRAGHAVVVPDAAATPYYQPQAGQAFPARALLGVPLIAGGLPIGAALLVYTSAHPFSPDEIATAELAGRQMALALARAQTLDTERRRSNQLEALREASLQLTSSLEPQQVLDVILQQVLRLAEAREAQVYLYDGAQLTFGAARWALTDHHGAREPAEPTPVVEQAARSGARVVVPDVRAPGALGPGAAPGALVSLPLLRGQAVRGVLNVVFGQARHFDQHELRLLDLLGDQAAVALENSRLFEAERRRARQLALLSEVSQQVSDTLDEAQLLQRTTDAMVNSLGFAEAAILVPAGDDALRVVALSKSELVQVEVGYLQKLGRGVIGQAVATRRTYVTNDVGRDPHYFDPGGRGSGSAIGLPLLREAELLGVLYIETSLTNAFSPLEVSTFETLARHVATMLQNARLFAGARQQLEYLTTLHSVSREIVASLELDRIFDNLVRRLSTTFNYRYVSVYVLDEAVLRLKAQVGYPAELIPNTVPITRGVMGRAVRTRQTQFVPDVAADPDFLRSIAEVRSEICVPLLTETAVLGTLNVETAADQDLTPADATLLLALAAQVTVALVNARLFEAERDQQRLTETLRAASLALSSSLDFEQVLDGLLAQVEKIVPFDTGSVLLIENGWTRNARRRGHERFGKAYDDTIRHSRLEVATTPNLAEIIRTRQPLLVADTTQYPGWLNLPAVPPLRAWVGVPIIAQGEVLALFALSKREPGFFTLAHTRWLSALAGQMALALQNARLYAAQRRRSEEQRLLLQAAHDLSAGLSQTAVLAATARHMTAGLGNDGCALFTWEREADQLLTLFDYAPNAADRVNAPGSTFALSEFPQTRHVLETRETLALSLDDPTVDAAEARSMQAFGVGQALMLPLLNGDEVAGLVEVTRNLGQPPFTASDVQLAQSLVAQAAVALDNARLHTAVQENLRELNALLKANEALLSTLELEPLLQNILDAAMQAIPAADTGAVILINAATGRLEVRAAHGYTDPRIRGLSFAVGEGFSSRAVRENRALLIHSTAAEPDIVWDPPVGFATQIESALVAPLTPKGATTPYGMVSLEAPVIGAFQPADLRMLVAFANAAVVAIDNARLHAEVQRLAVTDSLTELANPRAFEAALQTEFHRAQRYGYPLSLLIMDIDSFKLYNDAHGHPAGNERLKAIADIIRDNVRDPDFPARYGGEEFALLLPHTTKAGAMAMAERIRVAAYAAAPAEAQSAGPIAGYSLSLGVATFPTDAPTPEALVVAADNAELRAKRNGKNQVVAAPPVTG